VNSQRHSPQQEPSASLPASRWQRLGLRAQLSIVFGSLVVVLAICMSVGFAELLRWRMQRDAATSLHTVASNASRLLADGLFDRTRSVQVLASSKELWVQGLSAPGVNAMLTRLQSTLPFSAWIGVSDTHGVVRSATKGQLVGEHAQDRPWFRHGLEGLHVSDVHTAPRLSRLLPASANGEAHRFIDFSAPIDPQGRTIGVLAIYSNWGWVRETIESLLPGDAQERRISLFIFDRDGQLIYGPNGQLQRFASLGQELPVKRRAAEADTQAPSIHAEVTHWKDSEERFLTAAVSLQPRNAASDLGWSIVARQPLATAYAPARQAMYKIMAAGLAAAILAAGIAWLVARRLSQDLKHLARSAYAQDKSGRPTEIPVLHSSREVRHLSLTLRSSIAKLRAANEAMEAQVAERTLQLRQANAELQRLAQSDPLTGLLNRRGFESQLRFALALARRSQRPLSMLTVDIDLFKSINDRYGHDMGDTVLCHVARLLSTRLRESDVLARMGGEEFMVLLPETSPEAAMELARQLCIIVAEKPMEHGATVTVSIGASTLHGTDNDDGSAMRRRSDAALYAAKAAGRNTVCWQD
jgi:diguanylate cyclase (GGDEF)-like protein